MEPVIVGDVRARPIRTRGVRGPQDGRVYWRAELGKRTVWAGWASRAEAALILAQLVAAGVEGARPRVADIRTVRDLLDYWVGTVVDGREDLSRRTREAVRGAAKRVVGGLGDVRLDRITRATLDDWVGVRMRAANATYTVRFDLGVLRRAWRWGRELGATPNTELGVPSVKSRAKREKRTPDLGEIRAVIDWLTENAPAWTVPFIRLQAATGARVGEVANVRWEDVDEPAGTVRFTGKTGPRTVPVRRDVLRMIVVLPRSATWVWGVAPGTSDQVLRYVHLANDALGRPRWTTHGLRRLAVDTLARSGVEIGTAAALLGHSPTVMLQAYRQVSLEDLRAGMAKAQLGLGPEDNVVELPTRRTST